MRGISLSLILFITYMLGLSVIANAQYDSLRIENESLRLFESKSWNELIRFGKDARRSGFKNHKNLLARMGVAYYHKKMFYRSEKYLDKVYRKHPIHFDIHPFFYEASLYTGNFFQAAELHTWVRPTDKRFTKRVTRIGIEMGARISNNELAGHTFFVGISASHLPSRKVALMQQYMYIIQQKNIWGNFDQHQYYLGAAFRINSRWNWDAAAHFYLYNADINYSTLSPSVVTTPPPIPGEWAIDSVTRKNTWYHGKYLQPGMILQTGASRSSGPFRFSPFVQISIETRFSEVMQTTWNDLIVIKKRPDTASVYNYFYATDSLTEKVKHPRIVFQFMAGASASYTFPFLNELFTLGASVYLPVARMPKPIISPFLRLQTKRFVFTGSYFYKSSSVMAEHYASNLINTYDVINHRVNTHFSYQFTPAFSSKILYQWEDKTDDFSLVRYHTHTVSLMFNLTF